MEWENDVEPLQKSPQNVWIRWSNGKRKRQWPARMNERWEAVSPSWRWHRLGFLQAFENNHSIGFCDGPKLLQKWQNQLVQENTKSNENFGVFFQFLVKTPSFLKKFVLHYYFDFSTWISKTLKQAVSMHFKFFPQLSSEWKFSVTLAFTRCKISKVFTTALKAISLCAEEQKFVVLRRKRSKNQEILLVQQFLSTVFWPWDILITFIWKPGLLSCSFD